MCHGPKRNENRPPADHQNKGVNGGAAWRRSPFLFGYLSTQLDDTNARERCQMPTIWRRRKIGCAWRFVAGSRNGPIVNRSRGNSKSRGSPLNATRDRAIIPRVLPNPGSVNPLPRNQPTSVTR